MDFEISAAESSRRLRETFIERFVDTKCEYYQNVLEADEQVRGFLWDCLKAGGKEQVTQERAAEFLKGRGGVYFMWDHWRSGTVFADEYPGAVVKADGGEIGRLAVSEWNAEIEAEKRDCYIEHPQLPSDIYVFDEGFSWYVVFTHEFDDCESLDDIVRYCILYSE